MRVDYRIVEEITHDGDWDVVGVMALWHSDPPHLQLRGLISHTVSGRIWGRIQQRVEDRELTLETYHEALEDDARFYRLQPEIHTIERETAAEIREYLRHKYVFVTPEPELVPAD